MSNSLFIDTGVIDGPSVVHFVKHGLTIHAILGRLTVCEPKKGAWGKSPKKVQQSILEQVSMMAEGLEGMQMATGEDGKMELKPMKMEGFPEILEAAKVGTLRILIGMDSRGVRQAACVIVQPAALAERALAGASESKPQPNLRQLGGCFAFILGAIAGWWLWQRLPVSYSMPARIGIMFVVFVVTNILATIVSGFPPRGKP